MNKSKCLQSTYLYQSPHGNVRLDTCRLPSGQTYPYCVNEFPDWVNALVLTKNHKWVMVRQFRYPANDVFLEAPGGKVEKGEAFRSTRRNRVYIG